MSIFDKLKNKAVQGLVQAAGNAIGIKTEEFTFSALPESVAQMQALPESSLDSPFKTAALTVCALSAYAAEPEIGIQMLNFLRGPRPMNGYDLQNLRDRFRGKTHVPFSYFAGAAPQNDYTPAQPFRLTVSSNSHSGDQEGYCKLFIPSGGADDPRPVVLRQKGSQWFLWEQLLMSDIRKPASQDPWA